jgi:DNA invertase Pin-like site-specific DNA recombinase
MREQECTLTVNAPNRAAQYLRRSTEHQQYSFDNQSDSHLRYAQAHGMDIVRTYWDVESGVNLRDGLEALIEDVESGHADYSIILVYDVSRWGRFQDIDESAYYEYRCKRAGIAVHYCAEQFENDGSLLSSIVKSIKRSMAGEYSRELSVKVFAGQCRLVSLGFHLCGRAGYGLRRQLVDRDRNPKALLAPGERKSVQTDRIILVPGPPDEVQLITEIYGQFISGWNLAKITRGINSRRLLDSGAVWTKRRVLEVLTNEKYIGTSVYNRQSHKVGGKLVCNPREHWIRCEDAFTPIVSRELFERAQQVRNNRYKKLTNDELLARLRALYARTGFLTSRLVDEAEDAPCAYVYSHRFGSLVHAYELVGFHPKKRYNDAEADRIAHKFRDKHFANIVQQLRNSGATVDIEEAHGLLKVNHEFTLAVVCTPSRHKVKTPGKCRWIINTRKCLGADLVVVARLTPDNDGILDYYVFPALEMLPPRMELSIRNNPGIDAYRFSNLQTLSDMVRRTPMEGNHEAR